MDRTPNYDVNAIKNFVLFLFVVFSILSCENHKINAELASSRKDTVKNTFDIRSPEYLLNEAIENSSLEYKNETPFLFFKSGKLFNDKYKNAIFIKNTDSDLYSISIYSIKEGKWVLSKCIDGIEAFLPQFSIVLEDYNFDGHKDIYIQASATNGWSLSRGNLIIVDPEKDKFELHKEAYNFYNLKPDFKKKTIKSELWHGYDNKGFHRISVLTNKWIKGKLLTVSKNDIRVK